MQVVADEETIRYRSQRSGVDPAISHADVSIDHDDRCHGHHVARSPAAAAFREAAGCGHACQGCRKDGEERLRSGRGRH